MTGQTICSEQGRCFRLLEEIGKGGQSRVYRAEEIHTGETWAVKIFESQYATAQTIERIRYLVRTDLNSRCPVFRAPVDAIVDGHVGHGARWAEGVSLETWLGNPDYTIMEGIQMALAITHAMELLDLIGIAHGDVRSENVIVNRKGDVVQVFVLDLDNYRADGIPLPVMIGHSLYMAPEIRSAMGGSTPVIPDKRSDRFSLMVLIHEIILCKHPAIGLDHDQDLFAQAMGSGRWPLDRTTNCRDVSALGGHPVEALNPELETLIRSGFSLTPDERPTPTRWKAALSRAMNDVVVCPSPSCAAQFIADSAKRACPVCKHPFPLLSFVIGRTIIPLTSGLVLGRRELGSDPTISWRHASFVRIGPDTRMRAMGSNPTFRWSGTGWIPLPNDRDLLLRRGDRLRFGNTELGVE